MLYSPRQFTIYDSSPRYGPAATVPHYHGMHNQVWLYELEEEKVQGDKSKLFYKCSCTEAGDPKEESLSQRRDQDPLEHCDFLSICKQFVIVSGYCNYWDMAKFLNFCYYFTVRKCN